MNRLIRHAPVLGVLLALAACSSAPTHFYTLVPPAAGTADVAASAPFLLDVMPVGVPAQVDQPQMVVRQGDGGVALLEGRQWIAPLGDEIRSAVAGELSRVLAAQDVHGLPHAGSKPVYRVKLDVRRFDSVPGQYALVEAAWSVRKDDGGPVLGCTGSVREPVGAGYDELVRGHQQALVALADRIAGMVRRMHDSGTASCPPPA
jgi:uncharacterized lipoprotein YmbA